MSMFKKVYIYNEDKIFVKEVPVAVGGTPPRNSTDIAPPAIPQGKVAVFNEDTDNWQLVEDNRGTYWRIDGSGLVRVKKVGEPIPSGVTDIPQEPGTGEFDVQAGRWVPNLFQLKQQRLMELAREDAADKAAGFTVVPGKRPITEAEVQMLGLAKFLKRTTASHNGPLAQSTGC